MSRTEKRAKERMSKKQISAKLSEFSERLLKAPTAFETVATLQEMRDLNQTEIDHWCSLVAELVDPEHEDNGPLVQEAAEQIEGFTKTIDEINRNIRIYHAQAVLIEKARINSRLIKEPVILPIP